MRSLSATGSRKAPSRVCVPRRRAIYPSSMSVRLAAQKTRKAQPGRRYTSSVTKTGMSRMRRVVSQLASPIRSSAADEARFYHSPAARRPLKAGGWSGGLAIGFHGSEEARGQLDLEANAVGVVAARQDAAARIAVGERGPVRVRDAKRHAFHARPQGQRDTVEEPVYAGSRASRDRHAVEAAHERLEGHVGAEPVDLVEGDDAGSAAQLQLGEQRVDGCH